MAAAGGTAAGTTSAPYARCCLRQNRAGLWETTSQSNNLSSTAIATTQFLRPTGLSTNGYFHGHLCEFLLDDGTVDDETTFTIEDWLATRYGLL